MNPDLSLDINIDWNRIVYIRDEIDEALYKNLIPTVLTLKSSGRGPITVVIDSPGGSIPILEAIIDLIKAPCQNGTACELFCIVLREATSAAAILLALGDHSVAYSQSNIWFHDVRFSKLQNVTPERALLSARDLKGENNRLALKIAERAFHRLVWVYVDNISGFSEIRSKYTKYVDKFSPIMEEVCPSNPEFKVDVLGFALSIYSKLSGESSRAVLIKTLQNLQEWIFIEKIERVVTDHEAKGGRGGLMNNINSLFRETDKQTIGSGTSPAENQPEIFINPRLQDDLKLFLEIILRRSTQDKKWTISGSGFDALQRDFDLMHGLRDRSHIDGVINKMTEYGYTFLGDAVIAKLAECKTQQNRDDIISPYYPQARLFWYFTVLLYRSLLEGENIISAADSQLFGIVDEIPGGGPVESVREWRLRELKERAAAEPKNA